MTGIALENSERKHYRWIEQLLQIGLGLSNAMSSTSTSTAARYTSGASLSGVNAWLAEELRQGEEQDRARQLLRANPPGKVYPPTPAPPEEILPNLTQCQHGDCKHYTHFSHRNYTKTTMLLADEDGNIEPKEFPKVPMRATDQDWCGYCGRVASPKDYGKGNVGGIYPGFGRYDGKIFKPVEGVDVCLGRKTVPFTLISHDPRKIARFRDNWSQSAAGAPSQLKYDEGIMDANTFQHRIGKKPSVTTLLGMIPTMEAKYMPTTGNLYWEHHAYINASNDFERGVRGSDNKYAQSPKKKPHHANTISGMIIESDNHVQLLSEIFHFGCALGRRTVNYITKATWDARSRTGQLKIALYLKPNVFMETNRSSSDLTHGMSVARLLMCWYEIPKFTLAQLGYRHKAEEVHPSTVRLNAEKLAKNPWLRHKTETVRENFCMRSQGEKRCIEAQNKTVKNLENEGVFQPSVKHFGGMSPTVNDSNKDSVTGFRATMQRYFTECLPEDILRTEQRTDKESLKFIFSWTARNAGISRPFHQRGQLRVISRPNNSDLYSHTPETSLEKGDYSSERSYLTRDAHCLLWSNTNTEQANLSVPSSLPNLMNALENLGHAEGNVAELLLGQMTIELLPFQRQAVQWALERENMEGGVQRLWWAQLPENRTNSANKDADGLWFSPALDMFAKGPPKRIRGGLICEEMGLGKTVISLALCLLNPAPATPLSGSRAEESYAASPTVENSDSPIDKNGWTTSNMKPDSDRSERGRIISRGTLVVCHVSLVGQWVDEARSKLSNPGLVYPYYGSNRDRNPLSLAQNAIVVTTYAVLASDYMREGNSKNPKFKFPPCESIHWWRVICDESHSLRNNTNSSGAILSLSAELKWCVSGTPMNTTVRDLRNQMDFIGFDRNHTGIMFHRFLQICNERKKNERRGITTYSDRSRVGEFLMIMRSILMRHTMRQKTTVTKLSLMQLPDKKDETVRIAFDANELKQYNAIEDAAKKTYERIRDLRDNHFGKQYLLLMQSLNPMRMICSSGTIPEEKVGNAAVIPGCIHQMTDMDETECSICLTAFSDPHATPCKHIFCKDCIEGVLGVQGGACPMCRNIVQLPSLIPALPPVVANNNDTISALSKSSGNHGIFRSKFNELLRQLKDIRNNEAGSKSLIFSQFNSTLDFLQCELTKHGFSYRTLRGDMSMQARAKALRDFQNDPPTTVFLLSMRAGAVGINLTQANRVFLMEPALNPALVAQAVGRVHRIGQTKKVQIVRLIMKDSIEERMETLVQRKYGDAANEDCPATQGAAATTIVGNLSRESKSQSSTKREDFDLLFGIEIGSAIDATTTNATTLTQADAEVGEATI